MRISDWSSDVCSSDLGHDMGIGIPAVWAVERLPQHGKRLARIIAVVMLAAATAGIDGPALPCIAPDNALGARVFQIGRASCRGRVCQYVEISVVAVSLKETKTYTRIRKQ